MKHILFYLLLLCSAMSIAQTAVIKDKSSGKPVVNLSVVDLSETRSTLSDANGMVDLSIFYETDTLLFLHTSYQTIMLSLKDLKAMDYQVFMFPSVIHLDETVVSANRWEQKKREVSMHITNLKKDEILKLESQTSADLLAETGQVFIQKSQMGGGSPMIRGFASNKVLIVVDGVRMNNPIYRHGNLQNVISIDPNALSSSEVLFGPGSVIYGSDAIGGVMDFHTLEHKFSDEDSLIFSGNALVRYNSGNEEKTGHFDINVSGENWSSITSVTAGNFSDLKMGHNMSDDNLIPQYTRDHVVLRHENADTVVDNYDPYLARNSGYGQVNLMQKFAYQLNEDKSIEYAFHYSTTDDVPRFDRLSQYKDGLPKYAEWYYGPQEWMMHALKYEDLQDTKWYDEMHLQLAYQDYEESRHDRKLYSDNLRHRTEKVRMLTLNADFFRPFTAKHAIFYGVEGSMSRIHSFGTSENIISGEEAFIAPRYPDNSDYSTAALYTSYRYLITGQLTANAGLRVNATYAFSPFSDEFYNFPFHKIEMWGIAPNAMAGLVYSPDKTWQMNLNLSTGYRAPNLDDFGKVFDSEAGSVVVPNENLQPEYAYNVDFSMSKSFANFIRLDGGAYFTILDNAMIRDDFLFNGMDSIMYDGELSAVQAIQNIGRVNVYGAFAGVYADLFKHVSLKSQINYTAGEDQDGNPYRHVPPVFGQTHILVSFGNFQLDASAVYNGEISPDKLSPEEHGKTYMYTIDQDYANAQALLPEADRFNQEGLYSPAWYSLNLKVNYAMNENLNISAGVSNITDQLYRTYSSGIPAMGRSIMLSLRANF